MTQLALAARPRRLEDWPKRLAALVERKRFEPFAWGINDCGGFAALAYEACTGIVPRNADLPRDSAETAAASMALRGFRTLEDMGTDSFGPPMAACAWAGRGDIALIQPRDLPMYGVVLGTLIAAPGDAGLVMYPRSAMSATGIAWKI